MPRPSSPLPTVRFPRSTPPKKRWRGSIPNTAWQRARRPTTFSPSRATPTRSSSPMPSCTGELLAPAQELQGDRPLRPRRRQYRPAGGKRTRHRRQLRAGLLPARSLRPRHGAPPRAGPQGDVLQQARAIGPLGSAADRAVAAARRPGAGAGRLRQYSARAGAEGQGVRLQGHHSRSLCRTGRARGGRRRKRELRRSARRAPISSRCTRRCSRRRAG